MKGKYKWATCQVCGNRVYYHTDDPELVVCSVCGAPVRRQVTLFHFERCSTL